MSVLEKLDELLTKLDTPAEETPAEVPAEVPAEEVINTPDNETMEQNESSEDAAMAELSDKLAQIVTKQQEQIASLNNQIAALVKGGAQLSDGKETEVVHPPAAVPDEYVYLKDMDFTMNEREMM